VFLRRSATHGARAKCSSAASAGKSGSALPSSTSVISADGLFGHFLLVGWTIGAGAHGVAAGGSTGEGHTLDHEEYRDLMTATVET
jgi:4-hydroxy-tetrahydrodipicolinate synthase